MKNRQVTVYIALGFIISTLLLAFYFFVKKPAKTLITKSVDEKRVIIFKDVKYSGEKRGLVDWEIKTSIARKFMDKPIVDMEDIDGQYKPKPDVTVYFKGKKGVINTDEEKGTVEQVSIDYKKEYILQSSYMDFDFKNGITTTKAPIDIKGSKLTLKGTGLIAKTAEETVRIQKDIKGFVETERGRFRFEADSFLYILKENQYILDGRVIMKGETLNMFCNKLSIKSRESELERVEATGKVRLISQGTIAKGEKAVYYFKDDVITLTESPRIVRDNVEMEGNSITYNLKKGKFSIDKPKMRIER